MLPGLGWEQRLRRVKRRLKLFGLSSLLLEFNANRHN